MQPDLDALVDTSAADDDFKADVRAYAANAPATRIVVEHLAPRVKPLRVIAQLLHAEPALRVTGVRIDAWSGCSDYQGTIVAVTDDGERTWEFTWDCRWRAEREELLTPWGYPDQVRAAREWGWNCFERWEELKV